MTSPTGLRLTRRTGKGSLLELQRALEAEAAGGTLHSMALSLKQKEMGAIARTKNGIRPASTPPEEVIAVAEVCPTS